MKRASQPDRVRSLLIGALIVVSILLASCDSSASSGGKGVYVAAGGKGCTRVGILLPETASSARWETKDHPLLVQAVTSAIPDAHIDYTNAQGNSATQITQAGTDLANGDCMLIVGAHDSVAAAPIVEKARALNVPVIAYDRMIQSKDLNYYVSFNNVQVGQMQGQYIVDHYQGYEKNGVVNMVMISGSQTDTNALLFSLGAHAALDPLLATGVLKNVYETFTPDWDNHTAQAEMGAALNDRQNNIQVAYVANDGMAGSVISALSAVNLSGKVLVTGQDATAAGIHAILARQQSMTVYKPIEKEAQSTGALVKAIYDGSNVSALTHGTATTTFDGSNIPSILDTPIVVDIHNIASTVIADHYLAKGDVCTGIPAGTAGVC